MWPEGSRRWRKPDEPGASCCSAPTITNSGWWSCSSEAPSGWDLKTPLWTCWRVAHLIEKEFGISYHSGHVWKLLRGLNWSVQRPVGRALERDEDAIREWKK